MNKKTALLFLLVSILLLNSCGFGGGRMFGNEDKVVDKRMKQVVQTIASQNKDAFKKLFSQNALKQADNFDLNMDYLFELFHGDIKSWKRTGGPGVDEGINDDGTGRIWKEVRATYDIEISNKKYHISMNECTKDNKNSDNIGIKIFCIINEDDWTENYNYWGHMDKCGIIIE
jgi:hypothetical protein